MADCPVGKAGRPALHGLEVFRGLRCLSSRHRGLLERRPVAGDRRAFQLVPRKWPKKKQRTFFDALKRAEAESLAGLSASERKQLLALLAKLSGSLEDD